jgi:DnaK suppressor protein
MRELMRRTAPVYESQDDYRRMLVEKRREVITGLGMKFDTMARMGRVAEDDQAQISHDEFVSLRLNSLDYAQLRLVEEALDRLNAGDYGTCLCCEEPIPVKRLRVLPWARYCVKCQERMGAGLEAAWRAEPNAPHRLSG